MKRGVKRRRDDKRTNDVRTSPALGLQSADEDIIKAEVTTGEGVAMKRALPSSANVLTLKNEVAYELGISPMDALLFVNHHKVRDTELQNEETLRALRMDVGANLEWPLLVHKPDAQEVAPELPREPSMSLGDGTPGNDDGQFNGPIGAAFVPACPHLLVTTEFKTHCVKVSDIRTGEMVFKFGERGRGEGQFTRPWGVATTSDSSFVLIAELSNNRVQVLRLVVEKEGCCAHLSFIRFISVRRDEALAPAPTGPSHSAFLPGHGCRCGPRRSRPLGPASTTVRSLRRSRPRSRLLCGGARVSTWHPCHPDFRLRSSGRRRLRRPPPAPAAAGERGSSPPASANRFASVSLITALCRRRGGNDPPAVAPQKWVSRQAPNNFEAEARRNTGAGADGTAQALAALAPIEVGDLARTHPPPRRLRFSLPQQPLGLGLCGVQCGVPRRSGSI